MKKPHDLEMPSTRGAISKTEACKKSENDQSNLSESAPCVPVRLAYQAHEVAALLGGISLRSVRRLETRGLLPRPSRGLRKKLYAHADLVAFLERTK